MLGFAPLADLPLAGLPSDGTQGILAALYVDPDTFGTSVVGRGAVNISGVLYADADTFGANVITATYAITGARYADGDTFGSATVAPGTYTITGVLYTDADTFGAHTLSATYRIFADLFTDPDTFGTSVVFTPLYEFVSPGHERCMRCGFIRGKSSLRKEWTGLLVCEDTCWEPRHPQMMMRGIPDDQTVPWKRPEPTPVFLNPNDVTADSL